MERTEEMLHNTDAELGDDYLSFLNSVEEEKRDWLVETSAISEDCFNAIMAGEIDPILGYIVLSQSEKMYKSYKENALSYALKEFEKHGGKPIEIYGCSISKTAGATYKYDHDETWQILKAQLDEYQEKMKSAGIAIKQNSKTSLAIKFKN
jgi:hypothetical protein